MDDIIESRYLLTCGEEPLRAVLDKQKQRSKNRWLNFAVQAVGHQVSLALGQVNFERWQQVKNDATLMLAAFKLIPQIIKECDPMGVVIERVNIQLDNKGYVIRSIAALGTPLDEEPFYGIFLLNKVTQASFHQEMSKALLEVANAKSREELAIIKKKMIAACDQMDVLPI